MEFLSAVAVGPAFTAMERSSLTVSNCSSVPDVEINNPLCRMSATVLDARRQTAGCSS